MKEAVEECCPEFKVDKWDGKTFDWDRKLFLKETISTLFHIPFPPSIGKKVMKMHTLAEKQDASIPEKTDALILFRDPSAFKSEIYYAVTKKVNGANNDAISGSFEARVFDGPFNSVPVHIKEMNLYLAEKGKAAKDYYIHYAYCPKCSKKFGHNYMILFARV
jgi:hypothetical protein